MLIRIMAVLCVVTLIGGCAKTQELVNKRHINSKTKMSQPVFIEPVASNNKTIFVQIKENQNEKSFELQTRLIAKLHSKGYLVVDEPQNATFVLQANVLKLGKLDMSSAKHALEEGYGAKESKELSNDNNVVANVVSLISDVQIAERVIGEDIEYNQKNLYGINQIKPARKKIRWKKYKTRIVSTINKENVDINKAKEKLADNLASSIVGIF